MGNEKRPKISNFYKKLVNRWLEDGGIKSCIRSIIDDAFDQSDIPDAVDDDYLILNEQPLNTTFNFSSGVLDFICSIDTDEYSQKHTVNLFVCPETLSKAFPVCSCKKCETEELYSVLHEIFIEAGNLDFTFPTKEFSWIKRNTIDQDVVNVCKVLFAEGLFNDELSFAHEYGYDVEFLNGYYINLAPDVSAERIIGTVYNDNGTELKVFACEKDELKAELVKFAKCETDREIIETLTKEKDREDIRYPEFDEDFDDIEDYDDYDAPDPDDENEFFC